MNPLTARRTWESPVPRREVRALPSAYCCCDRAGSNDCGCCVIWHATVGGGAGRYVGFTLMWEQSICRFRDGEVQGAQRDGFVHGTKGAITSKIKHAIKLKTSPACVRMWVSFDPKERSVCGLATVVGGRGAIVGGASKSWKTCTTIAAIISIVFYLAS